MTTKKEIIVYTDGELNINVQFSPEEETVWLTQKQIELLFDVNQATVSEHISNILSSGKLDQTSIRISDKSIRREKSFTKLAVAKFATVQLEGGSCNWHISETVTALNR